MSTVGPKERPGGTPGKSVDAMSEQEKVEVVSTLIPRKHLVWIVPLVALGVVTTAVANSNRFKTFVEGVSPEFVDIVRKYVGFPEEDIDEDARVKRVLLSNSQPVDVTVTLTPTPAPRRNGGSVSVVLRRVSGDDSIPELLDAIQRESVVAQTVSSAPAGSELLVTLSFEDSRDDELAASFQRQMQQIDEETTKKHRPPLKGDADQSYMRIPLGSSGFEPSLWARASPSAHGAEATLFIKTLLRYVSSAGAAPTLKPGEFNAPAVFRTLSRSTLAAQRAKAAHRPNPGEARKEKIDETERRLAILRAELKSAGGFGGLVITREIDAIQADVDKLQRELASLKGWWFW